jgi:hypothetical protein
MGASGSGTTTLARAVADRWAVPHADVDDYFWVPSDPPYVVKRPEAERVALMSQLFLPREGWVLSGSILGWGDAVVARCDAVVFLTLDPAERLRRSEARERVRHEGRVVDEVARGEFLEWAGGYAAWFTRGGLPTWTVRCSGWTAPPRESVFETKYWRGSRQSPSRPRHESESPRSARTGTAERPQTASPSAGVREVDHSRFLGSSSKTSTPIRTAI